MREWKNVVLSAYPFLDGTVETLNVWDMLVTSADAEYGAKVGDVSPHRFKLVIGKDYGNAESPYCVRPDDSTEVLEDVSIFEGVQLTGGAKLDVFGDSH